MSSDKAEKKLLLKKVGEEAQEVDLSGFVPGEDFVYLGRYPYLWQGEEVIEYEEQEGLVFVNGKIRGINLGKANPAEIESPQDIVMAISSGAEMVELSRFPNLFSLTTDRTEDEHMPHIANLTSLKSLDLGTHAGVSNAGLAYLSELKNLRALNLLGTSVTDDGLAHLARLTGLCVLWLAKTKITGAGLAHLAGLKSLRMLGLSGTAISDADLFHLKTLSNLEYLALDSTQVTGEGVEELKKALPDCEISV